MGCLFLLGPLRSDESTGRGWIVPCESSRIGFKKKIQNELFPRIPRYGCKWKNKSHQTTIHRHPHTHPNIRAAVAGIPGNQENSALFILDVWKSFFFFFQIIKTAITKKDVLEGLVALFVSHLRTGTMTSFSAGLAGGSPTLMYP